MTKNRTSSRRGPKKPRTGGVGRRAQPSPRRGWLLLGGIICAVIIVVTVAASLWRTDRASRLSEQPRRTEHPANASGRDEPAVPNEPGSSSHQPISQPAESALTPEEQDRALRQAQLEVARRLAAAFPDDSNAAFLMGMVCLEQGDVVAAAEHLERSLELRPGRADAYDHLGRTALLKGEYEKAVALFRKALEDDPKIPGAHFRMARALVLSGKQKEAISALEKDLEISPTAVETYSLRGEAYLQLREYSKAKESYEAAIQIKPDHTKAYYGLATACARLGLKDRSREYRQKFKELEAEDRKAGRHWRQVLDPLRGTRVSVAHTHTDVGRVYHAHGHVDRAKQLWQEAATLDPNNIVCRFELAALYMREQRPLDALRLHEELTRIDPENGVSYFLIGTISAQLNRFEEAERAYKKVIEVAPERSDGYRALAQLYMQVNRNGPEAKKLASKAVELEPSAANYFVLAGACDKNGDRVGALSALEQAVKLDPRNAQYQRMYQLIQRRR
ncbi:MAG: tetratricopeptide repeat protein [Phycisphaerales bacterium]|nr:MAG: tetratricopeptide repeat protein [Phycisphaerales bacterium]